MSTGSQLTELLMEEYPNYGQYYDIYRKSLDIYIRARTVMQKSQKINFVIASAKNIKVENGPTDSTKVFTCR